MVSKDLSRQMAATYGMLRLGIAVLAFGLPLLLWIGGHIFGDLPLAASMSAYYHASDPVHPELGPAGQGVMRNGFVGILFAVSGLLLVYQGYSKLEDYALNLASMLALGIALFPMKWPGSARDGIFSLHGGCAVLFFACIAYVCVFRAGDTLPLIEDEATRTRYLRTYRYFGGAMVILPVLAWGLSSAAPFRASVVFVVELAAIYVFAAYWVVKSHEASRTRVDQKAARGQVRARPQGLKDALRPLPVTTDETGSNEPPR